MLQNKAPEGGEKAKRISLRLVIVIAIFAAILLLFLLITREILTGDETRLDTKVFQWLKPYSNDTTLRLMLWLTFFGSTKFLLPAYTLIAGYYLFFKRNTVRTFNVAAIGLSSVGLLFLMKNIFQRHRPPEPLIRNVSGFSYPSGHSFSSFTFSGMLMYILWKSDVSLPVKWTATIALFAFASSVAISRVYLHVHYASDVLAGLCLSFLWLSVCIYVLERVSKKRRNNTAPLMRHFYKSRRHK